MRGFILISCVVALAVPATARASVLTGPFSYPGNGHTYYLLSQDTWTASETQAEVMGGHLATINDAAEQSWVFATFGNSFCREVLGMASLTENVWWMFRV